MLRIGVLGAGHLGKIHLRLIQELNDLYQLVGFYDPDEEMSKEVEASMGIKAYSEVQALLDDVDVVDIVTPTLSHFDLAAQALRQSKHVFIEKPITNTVDEAKTLIGLAEEAQTKVQVGHVERFNPAFTAVQDQFDNPMFIETHRLAEFNPRGTDVPVVLDLMIHDIDIILSVVKSNIKRISASGVEVISETPDIANARIEFDNGCVANLTASRISLKNMRKSRFFQKDAYISVDFLTKESEVVSMKDVVGEPDPFAVTLNTGTSLKEICFDKPEIAENNAIKDELHTFARSILDDTTPKVTIHDGCDALEVAYQIVEKLTATSNLMTGA